MERRRRHVRRQGQLQRLLVCLEKFRNIRFPRGTGLEQTLAAHLRTGSRKTGTGSSAARYVSHNRAYVRRTCACPCFSTAHRVPKSRRWDRHKCATFDKAPNAPLCTDPVPFSALADTNTAASVPQRRLFSAASLDLGVTLFTNHVKIVEVFERGCHFLRFLHKESFA